MLIDRYLPRYDVRTRHEGEVEATTDVTYAAARELDLAHSPIARVLFGLRSLPRVLSGTEGPPLGKIDFEALEEIGFVVLGEEPGRELVVGAVGQFWRPVGNLRRIEPEDFTTFDAPDHAKGAMNFRVTASGATSRVVTETRVMCTDANARRKFRLYWALIGPFSGLIRGEMMRTLKRSAEAA